MTDITPRYISARLASRAEEIARWLFPSGERVGLDWCVGSIKGEAGQSCKICLEGEKAGRWADFARADAPGSSGDLLDLIAAAQGKDLSGAIKEACDYLDIERPSWKQRERTRERYVEPPRPKNAQSIAKAPAVAAWLDKRKISEAVQAKFKLVADGSDVVVFPYLRDGKLVHLKYRSMREKKFWSSAGTEKCLFGWQALNPQIRHVLLTEGEMDCLALHEYGLQALSIPYGAGEKGKQDWIENEWVNLERFDVIYLALDVDAAGMSSIQQMAERLGRERVRVVTLPRKDANACLMEGVEKSEIMQAIRHAKNLDPEELRNAADFTEEVIERFHPKDDLIRGFILPWRSTAGSFIFEDGTTTVIAGYSGHGKSELTGQIALAAARQGVRPCVASLEFKAAKWIQRLVRQATNNERPDPGFIRNAMQWLGERLWAVDIYGSALTDRLLSIFEYAHRRYGCRLFVVDNFTKLGIADDDLKEQKRVMNAITEFSVRFNVIVIVVHHLRKEETDYSAANMSKLSLKGSSAIGDLADNIWLMWRNRSKEKKLKDPSFGGLDQDEQNKVRNSPDSVFTCEKYRNGDEEPRVALWFDKKSHTWTDEPGGIATQYVSVAA